MHTEIFDLFGYDIYVSGDHRFGTDALLLAEFANPSPKDIVWYYSDAVSRMGKSSFKSIFR